MNVWTWWRTSPWSDLAAVVVALILFNNQSGWPRWLWVAAAVICYWGFIDRADKRWLRK